MARNGIVATSQPLAAEAGLDILKKGGNAIDAAVATAAVLSVVEPMNVGPDGDLFAIIYIARENKLYTLNASGKAPTGATLEHLNGLVYAWDSANWGPGYGMPPGGILEVTVPGAAWGWDEVNIASERSRSKRRCSLPSTTRSRAFRCPSASRRLEAGRGPRADAGRSSRVLHAVGPDAVATWYMNGHPPAAGDIFRNPGLAKTFGILQQQGRDGFYKGRSLARWSTSRRPLAAR